MSNTIRIRTTPNGDDKYLKVNIEQDFDFIEILSLNISQEEVYREFCSDYGVVVGRVIINSGFGVPNAKVSVFIPIDDVDKENPTIKGLYPYELVTDKDSQGIRYNLLPKESETNNDCFTPVGTFSSKREVQDNDIEMEIYCKYYKFTATTNYAGDFMIFGVPIGTYVIHVDTDISDMGEISQKPYDLIRQGVPPNLFESATKFMGSTNLNKLPQIKSANIGVNVQPFWGDMDNCQIGITRVDVDLNYSFQPAAIFIGSIFGDQDKNSVSKNCRPRKGMGELCEQVAGQGSIEMIRKDLDNVTETFDVDGGRVIDDDGTWAYQIPMNLDYVITAEDGKLIPSNDPDIGIPTRAKVRFRIGMDETGGEGRLRTRAKYLVPNNPQSGTLPDYSFSESTEDSSFKELYWNKIYSVSNFIPRYQKVNSVRTSNYLALKNVGDDACTGSKNPMPYNRVDTNANAIFTVICLVMSIQSFLIYMMNRVIIPLINVIIQIINVIIGGIVSLINGIISAISWIIDSLTPLTFVPIEYIGCISVQCPSDGGDYYAPGCKGGPNEDAQLGFDNSSPVPFGPTYYAGDSFGHTTSPFGNSAGLVDCIAIQMATELNMYKFDFYNDWLNGSLYSFLLKYKKRGNGNEKFCEFDCQDFQNAPDYTGVDGNQNGTGDNDCNNQTLLDTLYPISNELNCQFSSTKWDPREGLIKKFENEYYYASKLHYDDLKLFATDIICLGSVFECDWQGIPFLQKYLVPTSFNLPPETQELNADGTIVLETGMVDIGGNTKGQLFSVNCAGLHVNDTQALNFRHICEVFVDSDSALELPNGNITQDADGIIGSNDISDIGKQFRNAFMYLNSGTTSATAYNPLPTIDSDFNITNQGNYDFSSIGSPIINAPDYVSFRGYASYGSNYNIYQQPKHSFFMYFGLTPGKTAVDKLNQRYFSTCTPKKKKVLTIEVTVTPDSLGNSHGGINFTFMGGNGPYTWTVTGPNYSDNNIVDEDLDAEPPILPTVDLTGLGAGTYVITGTDALGYTVSQTVVVPGPSPLHCLVSVTQEAGTSTTFNGQITANIYGGLQPYTYDVTYANGALAGSPSNGTVTSSPLVINGLGINSQLGYTVTITDSIGDTCVTSGLTVGGQDVLTVIATPTDTGCYGSNNGAISLNVFGGTIPYSVNTTGAGGLNSSSFNLTSLYDGTYTTTVVDGNGASVSVSTIVGATSPQLVIAATSQPTLNKQCSTTTYNIPFYITAGLAANATAYISYKIDNNAWVDITKTFLSTTIPLVLQIPVSSMQTSITIKFSDTITHDCYSNTIGINKANITLPAQTLHGSVTTEFVGGNYTHLIEAWGGTGALTSPSYVLNYNAATQYASKMVTNGSSSLSTTITDSVGCQISVST